MKKYFVLSSMAMLFMSQSLFAQYYDKDAEQFCTKVNGHPYKCRSVSHLSCAAYGGLMMTSVSGNAVNDEEGTLGGLDLGIRLSNTWGQSCCPVCFTLNAYLDLKYATYLSSDLDYDENPTNSSAQLSITPGIGLGRWSIECGPFIGYNDYNDFYGGEWDGYWETDTHGFDYGLRLRVRTVISIGQTPLEFGLHYDIGLSDRHGDFKKNDLVLTVGYPLF